MCWYMVNFVASGICLVAALRFRNLLLADLKILACMSKVRTKSETFHPAFLSREFSNTMFLNNIAFANDIILMR